MLSSIAADAEGFTRFVHLIVRALEAGGVLIVVVGALVASGGFARQLLARHEMDTAYHTYRVALGRAILLGLEFLVAADIIATVAVEPSFENLGVLGLVVAIRTFLSFSLEVEINGRWPWAEHRGRDRAVHGEPVDEDADPR